MSTDIRLIYMTAANTEEAEAICEALIEERLIACANVLGSMTSIYRWQNKVQNDEEVAVVMKSTEQLVEAISARVVQLHSYDCPCVVAFPISGGNSQFLKWINDETLPEPGSDQSN